MLYQCNVFLAFLVTAVCREVNAEEMPIMAAQFLSMIDCKPPPSPAIDEPCWGAFNAAFWPSHTFRNAASRNRRMFLFVLAPSGRVCELCSMFAFVLAMLTWAGQ